MLRSRRGGAQSSSSARTLNYGRAELELCAPTPYPPSLRHYLRGSESGRGLPALHDASVYGSATRVRRFWSAASPLPLFLLARCPTDTLYRARGSVATLPPSPPVSAG